MSLWPREHGAYGQLAMPLATSLSVSGPALASSLLALSVVAGFLAHEPLLILLGRRGLRLQRDMHSAARSRLVAMTAAAAILGVAAMWLMPAETRWSLMAPAVPASCLGAAIVAGREKSLVGEVAAALMFSFVAYPISLAAGAPRDEAATIAVVFAIVFVTGTLTVRGILAARRQGRSAQPVPLARIGVPVAGLIAAAALALAASRELVPWAALPAIAPGLAAASVVANYRMVTLRLPIVGWTLAAASAAASVILFFGLGGAG